MNTVLVDGRWFRVLARFPEDDADGANAYMEAHPGAALLLIQGGELILAHTDDKGTTGRPATVRDSLAPRWVQVLDARLLDIDDESEVGHLCVALCAKADELLALMNETRDIERVEMAIIGQCHVWYFG